MSDPHAGPSSDAPEHPEPDPRLRGYPPPQVPGAAYPPTWAHPGYPPPPPGYGYPAPPPGYGYPPPGYGMAAYGRPPVPMRPPALPIVPSRYSQLLRGPRYRWWKPLLALALALTFAFTLSLWAVAVPLVAGLVAGVPDLADYVFTTLTDLDNLGPVGFVTVNLSLVVLIPTVMLATWIVHGVRPKFTSSVVGGVRWRWLLRCLVLVLPIWLVYVGLDVLFAQPTSPRPDHWVALLVIVLLMTPFQAAGEEYLFRGFVLQNVGAWFARPLVGLVVATALSTVVFSLAHGSLDVWVLGSIGCLAVAGCLVTWRTGGLEAAIAMHAVNNILVLVVAVLRGGWANVFVSTDTSGTFLQFALSAVVHGIALALIWWQAGKHNLPYLSAPAAMPVPPALPGPTSWPPHPQPQPQLNPRP